MTVVKWAETLPYEITRVWEVVTSLTEYQWRSDVDRIEVLDDHRFIEYTKAGYPTTFTVRDMQLHQRWEFAVENDNILGSWTGEFFQQGGGTRLEFQERVTAKKPWLRPFIKVYLKRQQARYFSDLKKALSRGQGGRG